jgi:hypothetical protein
METKNYTIIGCLQTIISHPIDTIKIKTINNHNINIKQLFYGIKYPLFGNIITSNLMFGTNQYIYNNYINNYYQSGFLAGIISSTIITPIELYKIKNQLRINQCKLFTGIIPTTIHRSIMGSLFFGSYNSLRQNDIHPFYSGALSGFISNTITHPIDVIKTRIQSNNKNLYKNIYKGLLISNIRIMTIHAVGGILIYDNIFQN